jgi:Protein of unknown function (DUF1688)
MNASAEPEIAALAAVTLLRNTATIRERASGLLARARAGQSDWFVIADDSAMDRTAQIVADVTRERYGDGPIPYHSRWRHFEAGGVDRRNELDQALGNVSAAERARAHVDLAVVSVLLDAGAGPDWRYVEAVSKQSFGRSEGLGVASFRAFTSGLFSVDTNRPLRVDAEGLRAITASQLGAAFQASASNPLVGLDGRVTLLRRLGDALSEQPQVFGEKPSPGGLFDVLAKATGSVTAHDILSLLLATLSNVWPAPNHIGKIAVGDCWPHGAARGDGASDGWMPFHKLSQWLTYSLLEPFEWAGVKVTGLDALTGLPEYRNGGLLLDAGVIVPKDASLLDRTWRVGDEFIVEWRALTVAVLDELAPCVRSILGKTEAEMPLACVLEGGTWAAGRVLAQQLRGGTPPLKIASDGTVF